MTDCMAGSEWMSGDAFDGQPQGLTALSAMQMYSPQLAGEWHNRDFGITLSSHRTCQLQRHISSFATTAPRDYRRSQFPEQLSDG